MPATGIAYGFDRTVEAADQLGLIPTAKKTRVLVTIFNPDLQGLALKVAQQLRSAGINTELYPDTDKLDKQFKYADKKGISYALVVGEEEVRNGTVTLKNLATRQQVTGQLPELLSSLQS
jgi:histidyl-tRNA synthetase